MRDLDVPPPNLSVVSARLDASVCLSCAGLALAAT